ncbi:hypothetical protein D3C78_1720640 [compost metagenome]
MNRIQGELLCITDKNLLGYTAIEFFSVCGEYRDSLQGVSRHRLMPVYQPCSPVGFTFQLAALRARKDNRILLHSIED